MATTGDAYAVKIGTRTAGQVSTLAAAQRFYADARDQSGEGGSTFPDGDVYFNGHQMARLSYNGRAWDLTGALLADFPYEGVEANPESSTAEPVKAEELAPAVSTTVPMRVLMAAIAFAAKKDTRHYLTGVLLKQVGTDLQIVATDGHRMLVQTQTVDRDLPWGEQGIILPRESLERIGRFVGKEEEALVQISYAVGHPTVAIVDGGGSARFTVTPMEGRFPDYERLFEQAGDALAAERAPGETVAVAPAYMKSAGVVAATLGAKAIFPFVGSGKTPTVFTFAGVPGAFLIIMPMAVQDALDGRTVQLLGKPGMSRTLAALKAHETRCRESAKAAKGEERETLTTKANGFAARIAEINGILAPQLPAPAAPACADGEDHAEA